ncbi:hypothetical protein SASPL_139502 [Salvia splendens]|uniref:Agglutinin domain-containing protein n=1 Tax=Salvia splendens TaxID=180675 RepID=A0A8X8ZAG7_SALSN|nr:uncharacterized protein LOC121769234 [Salvia splendens]XP_042021908.1 uncharacterized protein LOC121769234 [Salvia splendens]XP_042021909.1 uncharacterized protein LOC121769234 [Salvia splendens]KAG6398052.1 hypothetical protein SASPL_139502 [Salvia splendens]
MTIPPSIVLLIPEGVSNPYACCQDNGYLGYGGDSVFSPLVKIAVEKVTVNNNYVHLRFTYNNKYWQRSKDNYNLVAVSNQPVEDTTDPFCTLFEPSVTSGHVKFTHVQSGLSVQSTYAPNNLCLSKDYGFGNFGMTDWDALVKMPKHIALKGDNGMYLKAIQLFGARLQLGSNDATDKLSGHTVTLMPDGHVRLNSDYFGKFWFVASYDGDWVYGDFNDDPKSADTTMFWPIKIDENTIALQSKVNNSFCIPKTDANVSDCLAALADSIQTSAKFQVQELVMYRKIYDVIYRMEDARIYGETPFLAGTTTLTNTKDQVDTMSVQITYQDQKSYTFSRGFSLKAGVTASIETEVPFIAEDKIEVSFEISGSFEWDTTTTTTTSVTAQGSVPVPANSTVKVHYVGTRGTCNVPYSYSQEDQSSTTGEITYYDLTDGIYEGVSCYNFDFKVE